MDNPPGKPPDNPPANRPQACHVPGRSGVFQPSLAVYHASVTALPRQHQLANPTGVGAIFQLFRSGETRTKSELSKITGLARSTISARVDTLLDVGLLTSAGTLATAGGRRPFGLTFNPVARRIVAVDLGATHGIVALCDLDGRVVHSQRATITIADGPESTLDWVVSSAHRVLSMASERLDNVIGIGIGVPGPVEHSTGRPINPPIMPGWDRFDVSRYVEERLRGPVLVDNDVNVLALGERATVWPGIGDLVFVKVSTEIGAGIISGGVLQRGARGAAGALGHVLVPCQEHSERPESSERDLESVAGGVAIANAASTPDDRLTGTEDIVARLQRGEPDTVEAVRQSGRDLGEVLAMVVNLLNPAVVVLGGSIGNAGEHLIAGIREAVYRRSLPLATQHLTIRQSGSGELGGAVGAAHMVIDHVLAAAEIDRMLA